MPAKSLSSVNKLAPAEITNCNMSASAKLSRVLFLALDDTCFNFAARTESSTVRLRIVDLESINEINLSQFIFFDSYFAYLFAESLAILCAIASRIFSSKPRLVGS